MKFSSLKRGMRVQISAQGQAHMVDAQGVEWQNDWVPDMDYYVNCGAHFRVRIFNHSGVYLIKETILHPPINEVERFAWPWQVLVATDDVPAPNAIDPPYIAGVSATINTSPIEPPIPIDNFSEEPDSSTVDNLLCDLLP